MVPRHLFLQMLLLNKEAAGKIIFEMEINMKDKYTKAQRILAIIGIVVLVALYITALVASFFNSPVAQGILYTALFCTFFIPILIYLMQFLSGKHSSSGEDLSE